MKIRVTDSDMQEAAIDRPAEEVTVIQNEYMIGLISMKLEGIPKDRQDIDNNFIIMMAIIEESYEGPPSGRQWEEWHAYRQQIQQEWDTEKIRLQEFAKGLEEKKERLRRRHRGRTRTSGAGEYQPRWRVRTDLEPDTIGEAITKFEFRIWLSKFETFSRASTENGRPTDEMKKHALIAKLDNWWHERVTQALGPLEEVSHSSIIEEIRRTLEISFPETSCQVELF